MARAGGVQEKGMSTRKTILIVDDDDALRHSLVEQFGVHGEFATRETVDGRSTLAAVEGGGFDLILLDIGLPDMDGRKLCRLLRQRGVTVPIIVLTATDGEANTILSLDAGANDYVTKPFHIGVLLARIRAHLRQHEQSEDATFAIGRYRFKPALKLLVASDGTNKIRLTEKESAILKYLHRARERAVSRDVLLTEVWGYSADVTTHTLETHIYRLRQKIEPDPSHARILVTESGGYRLVP